MKTGLFFGSFNPIHIGHLIIANHFAQYAGLEHIWFVVSPQNPLKKTKDLLDQNHRLNMVKLAIENNPALVASNVEFYLPAPSYTIHTLHHLETVYPKNKWVMIMGGDTVETLPEWKDYETLIEKYDMLVYPRPNHNLDPASFPKRIKVVNDVPVMEISATYIRRAIRDKKNCRYLLPEAVHQYIMRNE